MSFYSPSTLLQSIIVSSIPWITGSHTFYFSVSVVTSPSPGSIEALALYCFISFHSIPFHSIPFHSIPFHSTPFHSIPFFPCSCSQNHTSYKDYAPYNQWLYTKSYNHYAPTTLTVEALFLKPQSCQSKYQRNIGTFLLLPLKYRCTVLAEDNPCVYWVAEDKSHVFSSVGLTRIPTKCLVLPRVEQQQPYGSVEDRNRILEVPKSSLRR